MTLARVLLAHGSIGDAMGLLNRLLLAADEGARTGSVIQILVLQAVAHQMQGDLGAARVPLQRVLTLAEPQGYVRVFCGRGPTHGGPAERGRETRDRAELCPSTPGSLSQS